MLVEKISNNEKLAKIIIKILKLIGITFIIFLIIDIIALVIYASTGKFTNIGNGATIFCEMADNQYEITFGTDQYFKCENYSKKCIKK